MKILFLIIVIAKVFSFNTQLLKTAFVSGTVSHLGHSHSASSIPLVGPREIKAVVDLNLERDVHDLGSALAHDLYPKLSRKNNMRPALNAKPVLKVVDTAKAKTSTRLRRIRKNEKEPTNNSGSMNFNEVIFDEASQTYIIPAELMQPYKDAMIGAREKVYEDEAEKFVKQYPIIGKVVGQAAVGGAFNVGLQVICVLMNSPIKPISNIAANKIAEVINANPRPEIAEKFFRGQCNHAGIEQSLWIRKMQAKAVTAPIRKASSALEDRAANVLAKKIIKRQKWISKDWHPVAKEWTKDRIREAIDLVCIGKYRPEQIFRDFAKAIQEWSAHHHKNPKMINSIINSICAVHKLS